MSNSNKLTLSSVSGTQPFWIRNAKGVLTYLAYGSDFNNLRRHLSFMQGVRGKIENTALFLLAHYPTPLTNNERDSKILAAWKELEKNVGPISDAWLLYTAYYKDSTFVGPVLTKVGQLLFVKQYSSNALAVSAAIQTAQVRALAGDDFCIADVVLQEGRTVGFQLLEAATEQVSFSKLENAALKFGTRLMQQSVNQSSFSLSSSDAEAIGKKLCWLGAWDQPHLVSLLNNTLGNIPLLPCHGDYTTWNAFEGCDGRLCLVDYEAVGENVPFADFWHLHVQQHCFVKGVEFDWNSINRVATSTNHSTIQVAKWLAAYLIEACDRDLKTQTLYVGTHHRLIKALRIKAQLLIGLAKSYFPQFYREKQPVILCVHQGYEWYGSDKMFALSVSHLRAIYPSADIRVHLPKPGVVAERVLPHVDRLHIGSMAVLRRANLNWRKLRDLPHFLACLSYAFQAMRGADLVYINTVVIWDYLLMARFVKPPVLLHAHEIPGRLMKWIFSLVIAWSGASVLAISNAVASAFPLPGFQHRYIVWNGIDGNHSVLPLKLGSTLNILLPGRYNALKGQRVLLEALALLPENIRSIVKVRLVGDVFEGQYFYRDALTELISKLKLTEIVEMLPFTENMDSLYEWADIVTMPSVLPEPFGLVAVEAMASGRPVIASRIGGLQEIVVDNETGLLFEAGNSDALADAISRYFVDRSLVVSHGKQGRVRYESHFTEQHYFQRFSACLKDILPATQQHPG